MILEITRKRLFIFGSFIVVMLAIPLTVFLSQRQQNTQSKATEVPDTTVVAIFNGGEQITKGEVRQVAEEQNDPSSVGAEALKVGLSNLLEMKILDKAAEDLGIEIDQNWVNELVESGLSENDAHYQVLKNQITLKVVKNREALAIQFWNPPVAALGGLSQQEKDNATKQLSDGNLALTEAVNSLERGVSLLDVGSAILNKYPSLKPVLAVNGFILDGLTAEEKTAVSHPQVYQFGDPGLDQETKQELFALNTPNVLKKVSGTQSNRGGIIFKIISVNDDGADTYDEWFDGQMSDLVDNLNVL